MLTVIDDDERLSMDAVISLPSPSSSTYWSAVMNEFS